MGFLAKFFLNGAAKTVFGIFGDSIVTPILNAYMKKKDVDLEKHKQASADTTSLAVAVLDANVKFAQTKSQQSIFILQWWPFRFLLFWMISVSVIRFSLASFDSTYWWMFGCMVENSKGVLYHAYGDVCSWSFPALKGTFGAAEKEFLFAFIIAKPVDTAVSRAFDLVSGYLNRR